MLLRVGLPFIAVGGVVTGVAMVAVGLPEATPLQSVLLELSSVPLSVAVAAGIAILRRRADREPGPRSVQVLAGGGAAIAFGVVLMVWAYAVGPRTVVHAGQALVWLGLLALLLVVLRLQPRRRFARYTLPDQDPSGPAADR